MRLLLQVLLCAVAVSASGCWLAQGTGSTDAGSDAGPDAGIPDAGSDAGVDAGLSSPLASGLDNPALLAVSGTTVFWTSFDNPGGVFRFDSASDAGVDAGPDGGGIVTIASGQQNPYAIAVDAVSAFWLNYGTCGGGSCAGSIGYNFDGALVAAPLTGGSAVTLATHQATPLGLALPPGERGTCHQCESSVFWVNGGTYDNQGNYRHDGSVVRIPLGGGTPTTLFSAQESPSAIAVDHENVYWTNAGTFNSATGAYNNDGAVLQGALSTTTVSTLAAGQTYPVAIGVDTTHVYWSNAGQFGVSANLLPGTGSVASVPIGGTAVTTLASGQDKPGALAVQDPNVYWVNRAEADAGTGGSVVEVPAVGGAPHTLTSAVSHPVGIAVGAGGTVYYSDPGTEGGRDGGIFSLPP
jgi:hypothetical protein